MPAPATPRTTLVAVGILLLLAMLLLIVGNPRGLIPGIAAAEYDPEQAVIEIQFEAGDRYFWLPTNPSSPPSAAAFVADVPGNQTLIQRSSYRDLSRLAYDEEKGGPDSFTLQQDHLYEINGVHQDVVLQLAAQPGPATGRDYTDDLVEASTMFWKRLLSYILSSPSLFWQALQLVGSDIHSAFQDHASPDGGEGGSLLQWGAKYIVAIVPAAAFLLLVLLLGLDALLVGALAALLFVVMGYWVLGLLTLGLGWMFDDNGPVGTTVLLQKIGLSALIAVDDYNDRHPAAIGASLFFVAGTLASLAADYLHQAKWATILFTAGVAAGAWLLVEQARNSSGRLRVQGFTTAPAILLVVMGTIRGAYSAHRGYWGLAAAFWLLTVTFAGLYLHHRIQRFQRGSTYASHAPSPWAPALAGLRDQGTAARLVFLVVVLFSYFALAAFLARDVLAGATFLALLAGLLLGIQIHRQAVKP